MGKPDGNPGVSRVYRRGGEPGHALRHHISEALRDYFLHHGSLAVCTKEVLGTRLFGDCELLMSHIDELDVRLRYTLLNLLPVWLRYDSMAVGV